MLTPQVAALLFVGFICAVSAFGTLLIKLIETF